MKKILRIFLAIPLLVFLVSGVAFGWGSTGGDGSRYTQLQETAVFYNNSDETMYHGFAVIIDTAGSGGTVTSGTTLGAYATYVDGDSDPRAVGIVANASSSGFGADMPVVVVTKGPTYAMCADATDVVTIAQSVGTSTHGGGWYVGGGDNLGVALEAGDGTDGDEIIVWVGAPGSAD